MLAVDGDGRVVFANAAFRAEFGGVEPGEKDAGALLGDFAVLTPDGEPMPVEETPQARASRGETFAMRLAKRGEDGALCPFEAEGRPLVDAGGEAEGGVVVLRPAPAGDAKGATT